MRAKIATACLLATMMGGVFVPRSAAQTAASNKPASPGTAHAHHAKPNASKKKAVSAKNAPAATPAPVAPPTTAPTPAPAAPPAAAQIAPPVPETLMNRPPVDPTVTVQEGLLLIDAPNSMLGEVLKGVAKATGAVVEGVMPTERIAVRLGPGNPRQVLAALLQGTPYDYLILGSQEKPNAVTRIVLSAEGGAAPAPGAPAPETPPQTFDQPGAEAAPVDSFPVNDEPVVSGAVVEGDQPQQPQPEPPQPPQPPQPNSPEQLFRELQQGQQKPPEPTIQQ